MSLRREAVSQGGHRISYLVEGAGPAIVVLPALLQSASFWDELGYVRRFATRHRVIVVDQLGRGESDRPTNPRAYGPESMVADVAAVLEQEDVDRFVVWGFASGAETAGIIARRRASDVDAAIFGGLYLGDVVAGLGGKGIDAAELIVRCAEALDRADWDEYFEIVPVHIPPELRRRYAAANDARAIAAVTRAELLRHRGFVMPPVPSLAYWAADDLFAPGNAVLVESMPIESAVIPGGHASAVLDVDTVSAEVEGFLARHLTE